LTAFQGMLVNEETEPQYLHTCNEPNTSQQEVRTVRLTFKPINFQTSIHFYLTPLPTPTQPYLLYSLCPLARTEALAGSW